MKSILGDSNKYNADYGVWFKHSASVNIIVNENIVSSAQWNNTFTGIQITLFLPTVHVKLFIRVQKTQLSRYLTYRNSLLAAPRPAGAPPPPPRRTLPCVTQQQLSAFIMIWQQFHDSTDSGRNWALMWFLPISSLTFANWSSWWPLRASCFVWQSNIPRWQHGQINL